MSERRVLMAAATLAAALVVSASTPAPAQISGASSRAVATAALPAGAVLLAADSGKATSCPPVNKALANKGRAIFSSSGNCATCHGPGAKGTVLAPNLSDQKWLKIDGSYSAIAGLVQNGVQDHAPFPAPMPPKGGAQLSSTQVCQVAAYVYSLSHH